MQLPRSNWRHRFLHMQTDPRVFEAAEDLLKEIRSHTEAFVVESSLDAAVRIAPAASLMRSAQLLDESLACAPAGATEATCLLLRSLVETATMAST